MVPIEKTWKRKHYGKSWRVMIGKNPTLGFWCGYVAVPKCAVEAEKMGYVKAPDEDYMLDAPEEITYSRMKDGMGRVIGFDLGHYPDIARRIPEKEIRRRANRFADWLAYYYQREATHGVLLALENAVRKFLERSKGEE